MQFDRQFSRVFMSLSSGLERGQLQWHERHWAWVCRDSCPAAHPAWQWRSVQRSHSQARGPTAHRKPSSTFPLNYRHAFLWVCIQVVSVVKNLPAIVGDTRDMGSIPGSGRSPRGGNGNPLQYSCLENPMDRGAWWATIHGATKSRTWLSNWTQNILLI